MELCDPHCHYWDLSADSLSGHKKPHRTNYYLEDYLRDMKLTGFVLKNAVFVEAISDDPAKEVNWVTSVVSNRAIEGNEDIGHKIVAYADLSAATEEVCSVLDAYRKNPLVTGIRQIVNHHPTVPRLTWPKVHCEYLKNEAWRRNFPLLAKYNYSFDLQLNPHQIQDALPIIRENPEVVVIVDHLNSIHLGQGEAEDLRNLQYWREGLAQLAKLPNVFMKLSMLPFVIPPKDGVFESQVKELVLETIGLFTTKRCMFASNYPVDKEQIGPKELYSQFCAFVENFTVDEKCDLFYNTARNVYKM